MLIGLVLKKGIIRKIIITFLYDIKEEQLTKNSKK